MTHYPSCSPRAASKLAHKTNTGSNSRCCYPRPRRELQRLRADVRLRGQGGPGRKRSGLFPSGGGESRGRRLTDAVIRTRSRPDFCGAWQAVTTTPAGLGTPGSSRSSSRQRPIDRGRKALFPETRLGRSRSRAPRRRSPFGGVRFSAGLTSGKHVRYAA